MRYTNPYENWRHADTQAGELAYDPSEWRFDPENGWMHYGPVGEAGEQGWVPSSPFASEEGALPPGVIQASESDRLARDQYLRNIPYAHDAGNFDYTLNFIRKLDPTASEDDVLAAAQRASQMYDPPGQYMPTLRITQRVADEYLSQKLGRPVSLEAEVPGFTESLQQAEKQASEKSVTWEDALRIYGPAAMAMFGAYFPGSDLATAGLAGEASGAPATTAFPAGEAAGAGVAGAGDAGYAITPTTGTEGAYAVTPTAEAASQGLGSLGTTIGDTASKLGSTFVESASKALGVSPSTITSLAESFGKNLALQGVRTAITGGEFDPAKMFQQALTGTLTGAIAVQASSALSDAFQSIGVSKDIANPMARAFVATGRAAITGQDPLTAAGVSLATDFVSSKVNALNAGKSLFPNDPTSQRAVNSAITASIISKVRGGDPLTASIMAGGGVYADAAWNSAKGAIKDAFKETSKQVADSQNPNASEQQRAAEADRIYGGLLNAFADSGEYELTPEEQQQYASASARTDTGAGYGKERVTNSFDTTREGQAVRQETISGATPSGKEYSYLKFVDKNTGETWYEWGDTKPEGTTVVASNAPPLFEDNESGGVTLKKDKDAESELERQAVEDQLRGQEPVSEYQPLSEEDLQKWAKDLGVDPEILRSAVEGLTGPAKPSITDTGAGTTGAGTTGAGTTGAGTTGAGTTGAGTTGAGTTGAGTTGAGTTGAGTDTGTTTGTDTTGKTTDTTGTTTPVDTTKPVDTTTPVDTTSVGTTVVPPDTTTPCPSGFTRDPYSGDCVPSISKDLCDEGYVFDPTLGMCVPATTEPPPKPCPDGYERGADGNCVPIIVEPPPKPCPEGYERDADGNCVPTIVEPPPKPCPNGSERDSDGNCVPTIDKDLCDEGYVFDPNVGMCVPDTKIVKDCGPGYELVNGECLPECGPGYERDEDGICRLVIKITGGECQEGFHRDPVTNECVPDTVTPTSCPDGQHRDPVTNECVPDTGTPTSCAEGFEPDPVTGLCVPIEEKCPDGQQYNPVTGKCEPTECPEGMVRNLNTGECEKVGVTCPAGQQLNPNTGKCEPITPTPCPAGQQRNPTTGKCEPIQSQFPAGLGLLGLLPLLGMGTEKFQPPSYSFTSGIFSPEAYSQFGRTMETGQNLPAPVTPWNPNYYDEQNQNRNG